MQDYHCHSTYSSAVRTITSSEQCRMYVCIYIFYIQCSMNCMTQFHFKETILRHTPSGRKLCKVHTKVMQLSPLIAFQTFHLEVSSSMYIRMHYICRKHEYVLQPHHASPATQISPRAVFLCNTVYGC